MRLGRTTTAERQRNSPVNDRAAGFHLAKDARPAVSLGSVAQVCETVSAVPLRGDTHPVVTNEQLDNA